MDDAQARDTTKATPREGSQDHVVQPSAHRADPVLLERARRLADLSLEERPDAFDRLNRDVAAALRAIEES